MKAKLEFDLNDLDDRIAHNRCVKATDMALALWQIRFNLRKKCENGVEFDLKEGATPYDGMELVLKELDEIFQEHNLIMDDLII